MCYIGYYWTFICVVQYLSRFLNFQKHATVSVRYQLQSLCMTCHAHWLCIVDCQYQLLLFQVEYLLYELREPILLAACSMTLSSELKVKMASWVDIYITLASVCDRFYEVVRDRRFKRLMRRYLKGLFLHSGLRDVFL